MTSTDGVKRGDSVVDTGSSINVPVGKQTLGRIFNVLGEPVDECGDVTSPNDKIQFTVQLLNSLT